MYLLDTNALINIMFGEVAEGKLTEQTFEIMEEEEELFVSEISFLEMAIKITIGKLAINQSIVYIAEMCRQNGITIVSMDSEQFAKYVELPFIKEHGDPFDRLIISVAKMNDYTLVSTDSKMRKYKDNYGIKLIW